VQNACKSTQSPRSRIHSFALLAVLALSACGGPDWNADQSAVYQAMRDWTAATTGKDANAMWEMLSPDAREMWKRELEGVGGVRTRVQMGKVALQQGSLISPEQRRKIEAELSEMPPDPDKMTAQEYYVWRVGPKLTAEEAERTSTLYSRQNVAEIEVDGDRATVILKNGDPDRISWVRHEGHWKFDLKPSTLRALEEVREKEGKQN
jgi:hypothetical protein